MKQKSKKVKQKTRLISSCNFQENITHMLRKVFWNDVMKPVKTENNKFEIHNYEGKIPGLHVRFCEKKQKFLLEQILNQ